MHLDELEWFQAAEIINHKVIDIGASCKLHMAFLSRDAMLALSNSVKSFLPYMP